MKYPTEGIATDAAHSMKRGITEYQAIDLKTGEQIFYNNLGNQTTNIGEFLGVVAAAKYIIENDYVPRIIYTDSIVAMTWFANKRTASNKKQPDLQRAEIFLKAMSFDVDTIQLIHWDKNIWGENIADFGNK